MAFEKNQPRLVTLEMRDSSNALQPGKTVTPTVSKDGVDFAACTGTVAAISGGTYAFSGTAADFNFDAGILKCSAPGCVDTLLHITTESSYTESRALGLDRAKKALPDYVPGGANGLPTANASNQVNIDKTGMSLAANQSFNNTGQTALLPAQVKGMDADTLTSSSLANSAVTEIQTGLAKTSELPTDYQQRGVAVTLPPGVATEAKQDIAKTVVDGIAANGATLAKQNEAKGVLDGVAANYAKEAKQDALKTVVDNIALAIANLPGAATIANAIFDQANGIATGRTLRQVMRGISAVLLGKGGATAFRDINDTKNVVTYTANQEGERTAVTLDLD